MEICVAVDYLSVKFDEFLALDNISFKIPEGAFLAILGPNGSGKSVLIQTLIGLITPTIGKIKIFGENPSSLSPELVGYVPQIKTLDRTFPAKSIELVLTGIYYKWPWHIRKKERQKALQALEEVGASHLAERSISKLSGGELQRVYLARCIMRNPRLIVLDEPATGIDITLAADLHHILENIQAKNRTTIIMATHDLATASHHASHVLLLNRRLICFGKPEEALKEDCLHQTFGHAGHRH